MKKQTHLNNGSKRIKSNFIPCIKKNNLWIKNPPLKKEILEILEKYDENNLIEEILDSHNKIFIRGFLDEKDKVSGGRINILPNGDKLARGGFSIFAKDLEFNFKKNKLWDVCYTNASGSKTYLYSQEKVEIEQKEKAKKVDLFKKNYLKIIESLETDLENGIEYLGLYFLLLTHIRVGNLEYYNHLKHKGLTTLQKKDIKIKDNLIQISFIGKDGIPQEIIKEEGLTQSSWVKSLTLLNLHLNKLKSSDFVFARDNVPIHSNDFSKILFNYCGIHFYPHIIRSFYADSQSEIFIKENKKATKSQVLTLFKEIAKELGHKKFNKKNNSYEIDYKVTLTNYIRPIYVEKLKGLYEK